MMTKTCISTANAPQAIGTYSQAVKVDRTVYLSGQIPLNPQTMTLVEGDIAAQIEQVFENLKAVIEAAEGSFSDVVKLNVYLTDLAHFPVVNEIMGRYFSQPLSRPRRRWSLRPAQKRPSGDGCHYGF